MDKDVPIVEYAGEWPFGAFWIAMNAKLREEGYPEVLYKGARAAYEAATDVAIRAAIQQEQGE